MKYAEFLEQVDARDVYRFEHNGKIIAIDNKDSSGQFRPVPFGILQEIAADSENYSFGSGYSEELNFSFRWAVEQ